MPQFKLTQNDFCLAAAKLGCDVAAILAVAEVESHGSGFYDDGFPAILLERHKFYRHADKQKRDAWATEFPQICNPHATPRGGYGTSREQRIKFNQAFALDPDAAMMACSWGIFQELGENYAAVGFQTVGQFVDAMKSGAPAHLQIFIRSIVKRGLKPALQRHNWSFFALYYNGANYRENDYDGKMRRAYEKYATRKIDCSNGAPPVQKPNTDSPKNSSPGEALPKIDVKDGASQNETPATPSTQPAKPRQTPTVSTTVTSQTNLAPLAPATETVTVEKQKISTFTKASVAITALVGFLNTLGINPAALWDRAEAAITPKQILIVFSGLALVALAVYIYDRAQRRVLCLNQTLIEAASATDKNTVELKAPNTNTNCTETK